MTRSTTATAASRPKPGRDTTAETRWMSVVFLQGDEADALLTKIEKSGFHGVIRDLSRRDCGDETRDAALVNGYVYDAIPRCPTDHVVFDDASPYVLTYNHRFGYVSLLRRFDPVVEVGARRKNQPTWVAPVRHPTGRRTSVHRL